jgi:hypothetical protein
LENDTVEAVSPDSESELDEDAVVASGNNNFSGSSDIIWSSKLQPIFRNNLP